MKARFGFVVAVTAGLPIWHPALAAEQEAAATGSGLEEVLVTAQRREERLEDVPAAITALTAAQVENANITRFQDLGELSAGVSISRNGAFTQPAVRGISTLATVLGVENNIALYIDGFYQNDVVAINADIANLDNLAILKGPQGTLYGRNATGGAILVNTLAPSKELTGKLSAGFGNLEDRRYSIYLAGPLSDRVRGSIAAYEHENRGYLRDVGTKSKPFLQDQFWSAPLKSRSLRTKLEVDVTDELVATFGYNYVFVDDPRAGTWVQESQRAATFDPTRDSGERDTTSVTYRSKWPAEVQEGQATLKWQTPLGMLSSYTGFTAKDYDAQYDFDGMKPDFTSSNQYGKDSTWQQTIDYAIDAIPRLQLVVGGMAYLDRFELTSTRMSNFTYLGDFHVVQKTSAYAGYLDGTYELTDDLFVTLGGRYSVEEKKIDAQYQTMPAALTDFRTPGYIDTEFKKFTPRAVVRYNLGARSNVYASVSTGFKSGTYNNLAVSALRFVVPAKQEEVTAYEVGFKTVGNSIRFDTATFFYDYTDLQTSLTVPVDPNNPALGVTTLLQNAPKAEIYGGEAALTYSPVSDFNLYANVAYLHARYTDFKNWSGTGYNPLTDLNVSGTAQDLSDQTMVRAPEWSGNVGADYTLSALGGSIRLASNIALTSDYIPSNPSTGQSPTNPTNRKQRFVADGYYKVNASIAWTDANDQLTATLWSTNLTDERYRLTWSGGPFGTYTVYSEPRMYGLSIDYKF